MKSVAFFACLSLVLASAASAAPIPSTDANPSGQSFGDPRPHVGLVVDTPMEAHRMNTENRDVEARQVVPNDGNRLHIGTPMMENQNLNPGQYVGARQVVPNDGNRLHIGTPMMENQGHNPDQYVEARQVVPNDGNRLHIGTPMMKNQDLNPGRYVEARQVVPNDGNRLHIGTPMMENQGFNPAQFDYDSHMRRDFSALTGAGHGIGPERPVDFTTYNNFKGRQEPLPSSNLGTNPPSKRNEPIEHDPSTPPGINSESQRFHPILPRYESSMEEQRFHPILPRYESSMEEQRFHPILPRQETNWEQEHHHSSHDGNENVETTVTTTTTNNNDSNGNDALGRTVVNNVLKTSSH